MIILDFFIDSPSYDYFANSVPSAWINEIRLRAFYGEQIFRIDDADFELLIPFCGLPKSLRPLLTICERRVPAGIWKIPTGRNDQEPNLY